ncbi:MAG: phosphotransferase [Bacilli bacterium]
MFRNKISNEELKKVAKNFFRADNIIEFREITSGFVNMTYEVVFPKCHYVLQQINTNAFHSPFSVMNNIDLVSDYLMRKCLYEGKSVDDSCVRFVKTIYGQSLAIVDGTYWRCMEYLDDSITYMKVDDPKVFEEMGKAVGDFHFLMYGFQTRLLDDTIPHFHDTPLRFKNFIKIVNENKKTERYKETKEDIEFFMKRSDQYDYLTIALENNKIGWRTCHNDTKTSNILINQDTKEFMCLIDLDTVMKGAIAYDYGDALRQGASTSAEDEPDLSKVSIDRALVESFTKGFLYSLRPRDGKSYISENELKSLYYGYLLMTLEVGIRFLGDYIDGDKYFRIDKNRPKQNLDRARVQIKLVKYIEKYREDFYIILNKVLQEIEGFEPFEDDALK